MYYITSTQKVMEYIQHCGGSGLELRLRGLVEIPSGKINVIITYDINISPPPPSPYRHRISGWVFVQEVLIS